MQKESITLKRTTSLTNTEMTSESDRENSIRKSQRPSNATTHRCSSASTFHPDALNALTKNLRMEQRSIMIVRTQKESLSQSLDKHLEASKRAPAVTFGQLHIREFAIRPGDNPGCRIGVSLTIEWEVQDEQVVDMEAYESSRPPRRDRGELNIPSDTRMQMLRDNGYSRGEIQTYLKMVNIARGQRTRTQETLQLAGAQELAQKLYRGVLNKTLRSSKKKKERSLIRSSIVKDQQLSVLRNQLSPEQKSRAQRRPTAHPNLKVTLEEEEAPSTPTDDLSDSSYDDTTVGDTTVEEPWVAPPAPLECEVDC